MFSNRKDKTMTIKDQINEMNPNKHKGASFEERANYEVNRYISILLDGVKHHYIQNNRWNEAFENHLPTIIWHSNSKCDNSPFYRPSLGDIALIHDEYCVNSKEEAKFLSSLFISSLKKEGFTYRVNEKPSYGKTKQGFLKYQNWESLTIDIVAKMTL